MRRERIPPDSDCVDITSLQPDDTLAALARLIASSAGGDACVEIRSMRMPTLPAKMRLIIPPLTRPHLACSQQRTRPRGTRDTLVTLADRSRHHRAATPLESSAAPSRFAWSNHSLWRSRRHFFPRRKEEAWQPRHQRSTTHCQPKPLTMRVVAVRLIADAPTSANAISGMIDSRLHAFSFSLAFVADRAIYWL